MRKKSNYFKIGLFVISSLVVLVVFTVLLGVSSFFEKTLKIETYFDESVQGLDVGSPVKYRGVTIGSVKRISFVSDLYKLKQNKNYHHGKYVYVLMSIKGLFNSALDANIESALNEMISNGLRVKLTTKGLTGTSFLEMDYVDKESNKPLEISWKPESIYVPSTQSTFTKIGASVDEFIKKLESANLEELALHIDELVVTINQAIKEANVSNLTKSGSSFVDELRQTNKAFQKILSSPGMQNAPAQLSESLDNLSKSMKKLNGMLNDSNRDIHIAVENLRLVTEDLREVSSNAKKYPSLFFFGEPPSRTKR
ncbi:MAG: MCE family protein [Leptospiraceae bacterium]|nr:MCE family protein [Leptospiraceae bacterium]MCP5493012.1 MCE family protein [Leptospiraceae bacterium]